MATVSLNWGSTGVYERQKSNVSTSSNTGWVTYPLNSGSVSYRRITIALDEVFGTASPNITKIVLTVTAHKEGYSTRGDYSVYATKSDQTVTQCKTYSKAIYRNTDTTWTDTVYPDLFDLMSNKFTYNGHTCIELTPHVKNNASSNTFHITNVSVTITYAPPSYTITTSAGTGGSISPSSPSVESGSSQTFTITPNTGYNVSDVKVDGTSVGAVTSYTFNNVSAAHTISATFAKKTYKITTTAGTGGSISPSNPNVEHGTNKAFTITPNAGYQISDVKVDGTSVGAVSSYTFSNVTATHTIAATFALKTYTITATAGSHGSISPASASVTHGGSQTFTITPATGYNIEDVKVDGVSVGAVSNYTFSNVTAAHTISATFVSAQTQPYITSAAITYGGSQVGPSNKVPAGQGFIITIGVTEQ